MTKDAVVKIEDAEIVLAVHQNSFWLVRGEKHLDELLQPDGDFPTPVLGIGCETWDDVTDLVGDSGATETELWQINPLVVKRLRDTGALIELTD